MAATPGKLAQYKELLINLLPKGRLWRPKDQPTFSKLLESTAQELCRVDDRVKQMLIEVEPSTADEALDTWEGVLGLPDECTPDGLLKSERQNQLVQKLTNIGGLSKTFFEFGGAQLGFVITADNHLNFVAGRARAGDKLTNYFNRHFVAGSVAGTSLTEVGWRFVFGVEMPITAAEHFVAGSFAGDPVRSFSNELIECTIKKLKSARSQVFFTFKE